MPLVILLFALVALIYASVGFGGGSTYTALLGLWGVDYRLIPAIALSCNIVVVAGGSIRYYRSGLIEWRAIAPLLAISAPMAFLGGLVPLSEAAFYLLVGSALFLSSLALFVPLDKLPHRLLPKSALLGLSAGVGLIAGLSGIGGGIFLAPLLHLVRWSDARRIAAFASIYILINSIAGLAGQFAKSSGDGLVEPMLDYWPLLLAVLVGGQVGGMIGLRLLEPKYLRWLTAVLVAYVAIRLLWRGLALG